jgi:putative tricarboxylic transport membrane protein
MKRVDQITGVVFLLFSAFVIEEALRMPKQAIAGRTSFGPGVGFLPFWIGIVIAFLAILLIITASMRPTEPTKKASFPSGYHLVSVILLPVSLGVYIYTLDILGYLIGTLLFTLFLMRMVMQAKWKLTLTVSILASVSLYVIFQVLLEAGLPKNMFGF